MHHLKFANENMQQFSKRYYIIHEKHDNIDELFVVDIFMANEKRSVKTLSGGETFLVSLALALGLSKLAGKNTKIEKSLNKLEFIFYSGIRKKMICQQYI